MKYYLYGEPCFYDGPNDVRLREVVLSEKQILDEYFDYWASKMIDIGKGLLVSEERCVEDWCVVHWADFIGEF